MQSDIPCNLSIGQMMTPLGDFILVWDAEGEVVASDYGDHQARLHQLLQRRLGQCKLAVAEVPPVLATAIDAYFAGDLAALNRMPVRLNGTAFQNRAWAALRQIPPGARASYAEQAALLGNPKAARAIGSANRNNPCNLVIPCHRLVGSDGALTGYAGGLERKRWLLNHEHRFSVGGSVGL